jgi:hypothetical protein
VKKSNKKRLEDALVKKATGYFVEEITEEYSLDDGETKLVKRKVVKKDVPPDMTAIKILLDGDKEKSIEEFTDEELEQEKARLISELKHIEENNEKGD